MIQLTPLFQTVIGAVIGAIVSWFLLKHQIRLAGELDDKRQNLLLAFEENKRKEDLERDAKRLGQIKNSHILLMLEEIKRLQDFLVLNIQAYEGYGYIVDTRIVHETITNNGGMFNNPEMLEKFVQWKTSMANILRGIEVLNSHGQNQTSSNSMLVRGNWNSHSNEAKEINKVVRKMLVAEFTGTLPKHLENWRIS
jgi:hypothetical protein